MAEAAEPQAASILTASDAPLAQKIGDQRAQMTLLVQFAAGHVADINGIDTLYTRIFHGRAARA